MNVQESVRAQLGLWHGTLESIMSDCSDEVVSKKVADANIESIGAIYAHIVFGEDFLVNGMLQGKPTLYERDGWQDKLGISEPGAPPAITDEWAKTVRITPAFKEFAKAVFAETDAYLAGASDAEMDREMQTQYFGKQKVGWLASTILGTHAPGHAGEIAALKGVQGLKGLPF
jgi:hypothetical protein